MSENFRGVILLIEDDHDVRVAVRSTLEMSNYKVLSAANGKIALEILGREKPDLIILDMVMPLMDGEEFLKIRENIPDLKNIPVFAISSHTEKLKFTSTDGNLSKPLDMEEFLGKLPEIIGRKNTLV